MPSRARHTKSRFGCHTCRTRKVRCDETWPECQKCTRSGRKCDGPSQQKFIFVQNGTSKLITNEGNSLIRPFPPSSNQLNPLENRAFQYFIVEVAPCLAGSQDEPFWTYFVPRLCEANAAVRHAVLAISCMYEHRIEAAHLHTTSLSPANHTRLRALQWHSQSIKGFRAILSESNVRDAQQADIALTSCVLLACIEYVQNNVVNASKLLNNGYSIASMASARQGQGQACTESAMIREILTPILVRQTIHMTIFGYEPPQAWSKCFHNLAPAVTTSIISLSEARESLYSCLWGGMAFIQSALPLVISPQIMSFEQDEHHRKWRQDTLEKLDNWRHNFQTFQLNNTAQQAPLVRQATSAMLMYFHVAYAWITCALDITHTQHDSQTHRFEQIINCAEQVISIRESAMSKSSENTEPPPAFTFDMCVIPPLFLTGWLCRHPLLRRKCIQLLRRAPRQEALFVAEWEMRAIEEIIVLEESTELRMAAEEGRWDGVSLAEAEMRCQHVTIHHEDFNGRKVSPRLVCLRKIRKGVEGHMERLTVELYPPN